MECILCTLSQLLKITSPTSAKHNKMINKILINITAGYQCLLNLEVESMEFGPLIRQEDDIENNLSLSMGMSKS